MRADTLRFDRTTRERRKIATRSLPQSCWSARSNDAPIAVPSSFLVQPRSFLVSVVDRRRFVPCRANKPPAIPPQLGTAIFHRTPVPKIRRFACRHPRRIPRPTTYLAFQLKTSSRKIAWKNAIVGVPSSSSAIVVVVRVAVARCPLFLLFLSVLVRRSFVRCCPLSVGVRCLLSVVVVCVSHGCCTNSMREMSPVMLFVRVLSRRTT